MTRRSEPVTATCMVCSEEFETYATSLPKFCPNCREARRKQSKQLYDQKRRTDRAMREHRNNWRREARRANPEAEHKKSAEYYERQKQKPGFMENRRKRGREFYRKHSERIRAESRKRYMKKREAELLEKRARHSADAAIQLMRERGQLLECPRLHLRAKSLPCGIHSICFGTERCPHCPEGAHPPSESYWKTGR